MVTILDYGAGNLTSVRLAFERLGETPRVIKQAEDFAGGHLVFPGVGSAGSGMEGLRTRGFDRLLQRASEDQIPTLGICLGMQLLLSSSEEDGATEGLGLIPGIVRRFNPLLDPSAKIPHMGWNTLRHAAHPIFNGIAQDAAFYYVHSYFVQPTDSAHCLGTTHYCGTDFTAVIGKGSLVATQFHPERSGETGAQLLANFLTWEGTCF